MNVFSKIGIAAGGTLVLLAAAVVGTVQYVQHTDMAPWAVWGAKKAGVDVAFGGPLQVQLWPQVLVKAEGVRVQALQGEGTLAEFPQIAVQADWGRGLMFWQGVQLRAIEAKDPSLTLVRNAEGVANWAMPSAVSGTETAAPDTAQGATMADITRQGGMLAALRLAVQNLNLTYIDAVSGQQVLVRNTDFGARMEGTIATTTLKGTVNNQPLSGEMVADVANLDDIPLKARMEGAGAEAALDGRVHAQQGFAGMIKARSENLKATATALLGTAPAQLPAEAASVNGDVTLGAEAVKLRNFSARLGSLLQARGDVEVGLQQNPSGKGQLQVQGANLRGLVELLGGAPQPTLPARPFTFSSKVAGENAIRLEDMNFNLDQLLVVSGVLDVVPTQQSLPDVQANLTAQSPNIRALMQAFAYEGEAPREGLQARIKLAGKDGVFVIEQGQAELAELAILTATGQANLAEAAPSVDIQTKIKGDNMAAAAAAFGVKGQVPANPFALQANVQGSGPYSFRDVAIDLPGLLKAAADLSFTPGAPANLQGGIDVTMLQADKLGFCAPAAASAGAAAPAAASTAASAAPWSDEALDLSGLRQLALNVKVTAQGIVCGNVPLQSASLTLRNTPSQLDLSEMNLGFAGDGRLSGAVTLAHAGTPRLTLDMAATKLAVERFVPAMAAQGVVLPLSGEISLVSRGESTRLLAQNLNGRVTLKATEGQLPYGQMLGNVVALERLLQGQAQVASNGDGRIDAIDVVLVLRDGLGTFETLKAATGGGALSLTGQGGVNLPGWTIDLTLNPTVQASSVLSVPVLVQGPLTAPSIGASPDFMQRLTARLASEGIQGALGLGKEASKGIGGVVGDVLSGKGVTREGVGNLIQQFVQPKAEASPTDAAPETPASETPAAENTAPAETAPATPVTPADALKEALPGLMQGVFGR